MELEKSWASVMHQDHTDFANRRNDRVNRPVSQQRRQRFRPMWRVREHMAFLIRNLQFYIQVIIDAFKFHFYIKSFRRLEQAKQEKKYSILIVHLRFYHIFTEERKYEKPIHLYSKPFAQHLH